jgi:hypothetical protein
MKGGFQSIELTHRTHRDLTFSLQPAKFLVSPTRIGDKQHSKNRRKIVCERIKHDNHT